MKTVDQLIEELRRYPGHLPIVVPQKPGQSKAGDRDLVDPMLNDTMAMDEGGAVGSMVRVIVIEAY